MELHTSVTSKTEYINQWVNYVESISILGMNKDEQLSKRVFEIVKELKEIIPKIADTKDLQDEVKK
tara:strand:+ start:43 stop:240 length:198 start_codon:yes stop_codon:yes gene_type:complete